MNNKEREDMDILFKNSFTLTEKILLECRVAYTKKLGKEMKSLPHEFGAAVGYSMIIDEIKTIDDAINEATLEMIANKQDLK